MRTINQNYIFILTEIQMFQMFHDSISIYQGKKNNCIVYRNFKVRICLAHGFLKCAYANVVELRFDNNRRVERGINRVIHIQFIKIN
jgi:hypothetical protein